MRGALLAAAVLSSSLLPFLLFRVFFPLLLIRSFFDGYALGLFHRPRALSAAHLRVSSFPSTLLFSSSFQRKPETHTNCHSLPLATARLPLLILPSHSAHLQIGKAGASAIDSGQQPEAKQAMKAAGEAGGSSTLRILVATDCHLGYLEKDELRRSDSFDTFEEIFSLAEKHNVDFLLLGGDLFHENKPSRSTLVRTIEILRRRCLHDRPVQFQVVSDHAASLQNLFGRPNFEDQNINVGLPVFTIHGDHDDPTGVDNMSAIDVLAAAGFVNYFGKVDIGSSGIGHMSIHPILVKKGATSVALYGLGNVRDARLSRMFQTPGAIDWMKHESTEDMPLSDWFNILVLHQNRIKGSLDNGINEHLLPNFLDLVIWGHEHECLADPKEVPGMGFHITQPGSSIATSLTSAEAKEKHVLLLEINGMKYRPTNIPLKTVRPFEYAEVVLEDQEGVDANDEASVDAHLNKVVANLIEKNDTAAGSGSEPKLPLVRLKVDYSGFLTIHPQRFGQKYVGKVANPQDMIVFSRSAKRRQNPQDNTGGFGELYPNELNQHTVEALVAEINLNMQVLPLDDLDTALHVFVNKEDNMAFHSCLQKNTEEAINKLTSTKVDTDIEDEDAMLVHGLGQFMQAREKGRTQTAASVQSLATSTLEELKCSSDPDPDQDIGDDSNELIETSDGECHHEKMARPGKRPAPSATAGGSASSPSSSTRGRKTDLASFCAPAVKEELDDRGTKKVRPSPHVAGRYGAVRRNR
ncbi:double-strand break repair protein MRE11-like isoform X3 [Triticum urartu]|uniref:double-strand break repair protein MRE11-like isoform X3 n=1 Tax=Triticum urartu TaxID=4572 RepID=UPI002044ABFE|nr:double-strand break repair protein MRE11-like isoform X3 [Triticum urartu]